MIIIISSLQDVMSIWILLDIFIVLRYFESLNVNRKSLGLLLPLLVKIMSLLPVILVRARAIASTLDMPPKCITCK